MTEVDRRAFLGLSAGALATLAGCGTARREGEVPLRELERQVARAFARAFGLRHDEEALFAAGWEVYERVVGLVGRPDGADVLRALHDASEASVTAAMARLRDAMDGRPWDLPGYRAVARLPVEGRYVVTSDHHASFHGHRTNFFQRSGNLWLCAEALRRYLDAGFTLIENGDVEELVIFDPSYEPGEVEARRSLDLDGLAERRRAQRLRQLSRNLADPANRAIVEVRAAFDADRRLVRVVGNHDYDTQRDPMLEVLRGAYPNLDRPWDLVVLDGTVAGRRRRVLVVHGHQFDLATNPVSGPRFGETVSETLGLWYQGADRIWLWAADGVADWAVGRRPFANRLASREAALASDLDLAPEAPEAPFEGAAERSRALARTRSLLERSGASVLEHLFKQAIAWQYFHSRDPATGLVEPSRAVVDEVLTGDRFFKYELLDEERIRRQLLDTFPDADQRPILVLGHSHEPRIAPWSGAEAGAFPWYVNTASAGQYENLLWAAEVVDGAVDLVSWSRVPAPTGPLERRVWRPAGGQMRADADPSGVPSA